MNIDNKVNLVIYIKYLSSDRIPGSACLNSFLSFSKISVNDKYFFIKSIFLFVISMKLFQLCLGFFRNVLQIINQ